MIKLDSLTPDGKRFLKELEKLKGCEVVVGFQHGENQDDKGVDIADIALFNEFGTANTPPRPFFRESVRVINQKLPQFWKGEFTKILEGSKAEDSMKNLGVLAKAVIQQTISEGKFEPNSPATIKKKGSDKPLIDTGQMRQSVSFTVKKKGKGGE
jgi:hypothetical protein